MRYILALLLLVSGCQTVPEETARPELVCLDGIVVVEYRGEYFLPLRMSGDEVHAITCEVDNGSL